MELVDRRTDVELAAGAVRRQPAPGLRAADDGGYRVIDMRRGDAMKCCERWCGWRGRSRASAIGGCRCWCDAAGEAVNHKRVYRVYREADCVCGGRSASTACERDRRCAPAPAANQEWALDFVHDVMESGRTIRVLSVVDAFTRECLALEVDTSFASRRVTRVLDQNRGGARDAAGDSLRQRAGADESSFSGVVPWSGRSNWCTSSRASRRRTHMWRASTGGCARSACE